MESQIQDALKQGEHYSAHQLILSISQRKLKANKPEEAINLLVDGSCALAKEGQALSAAEIALRLIEVLKQEDLLEKHLEEIVKVAMGLWSVNREVSLQFIDASGKELGDQAQELARRLALALIARTDTKWADFSEFLGASADLSLLSDSSLLERKSDNPVQDGSLLALELVCHRNFAGAKALLDNLKTNSPVLSVVRLLFHLAQRRNPPRDILIEIRRNYRQCIESDARLSRLITIYEAIVCPQKQAPVKNANPMADMLQSLLSSTQRF